jgi:hypothetical protein
MQRALSSGFHGTAGRCSTLWILALGIAEAHPAEAAPPQAGAWPIMEFQVLAQGADFGQDASPPWESALPVGSVEDPRALDGGMHEISRVLSQAGRMLHDWGFPPPVLEPVVMAESGRSAYGVFLVQGLEGTPGEYLGLHCSGGSPREPVIVLDADQLLDPGTGRLTAFGTAIVIHELIHAVQAAFPALHCDTDPPGQWIREGSADAIAWDLTRRLRGPGSPSEDRYHAWGGRDYSVRLPVPGATGDPPGYTTSSFWRYLAEYAGMTPVPPGPEHDAWSVDYSYLVQLLGRHMGARDCFMPRDPCRAELAWLDDGLRDLFGLSLREVFGRFIQAYSQYGRFRVAFSEGGDASRSQEDWLETSFTHESEWGCPTVRLGPGQAPGSREFVVSSFDPVAARCWKLDVDGFQEMPAIRVTARGLRDAVELNQLTAILADSSQRIDPVRTAFASSSLEPSSGSWCFDHIDDGDPSLFLLTNVADEAAATNRLSDLAVTFSLADGC